MHPRTLVFISALVLFTPAAMAGAQIQRPQSTGSPGYREGYERGLRAGVEDGRRNQAYDYRDESDYRNADAGYRREYGDRNRYSDDFRYGYEAGYRGGYDRDRDRYDDRRGGPGGPPEWSNGRGRGPGGPDYGRRNQAHPTGFNDGYDAGLKDGRDRRRFDPVSESRYRSGDRGYDRSDGPREEYRFRYREAFRQGYERGYQDARRYDGRNNTGRPSWWPF